MMTSSPGLITASRLAIIASVAPHVTVILRSGSHSSPLYARAFSAIALRKFGEPCVIAYWLYSSSIARLAASLIAAGAGNSGNPYARLTAPVLSARRVISRMTDSVKNLVFVDTSADMARTVYAGKRTPANCTRMAGILEKNGRRVGKEAGFYSMHASSEARPVNSFVLGNIETDFVFSGRKTAFYAADNAGRARDSSDSFPPHGWPNAPRDSGAILPSAPHPAATAIDR